MRQTIVDESNLGVTLDRSQSRRHPAKIIFDRDFADDIGLSSNTLEQAQLLMSWAATSAQQIGLHLSNSKTEYIKFTQGEGDLEVLNGESSTINCCL